MRILTAAEIAYCKARHLQHGADVDDDQPRYLHVVRCMPTEDARALCKTDRLWFYGYFGALRGNGSYVPEDDRVTCAECLSLFDALRSRPAEDPASVLRRFTTDPMATLWIRAGGPQDLAEALMGAPADSLLRLAAVATERCPAAWPMIRGAMIDTARTMALRAWRCILPSSGPLPARDSLEWVSDDVLFGLDSRVMRAVNARRRFRELAPEVERSPTTPPAVRYATKATELAMALPDPSTVEQYLPPIAEQASMAALATGYASDHANIPKMIYDVLPAVLAEAIEGRQAS
jgi:hypothetical protein